MTDQTETPDLPQWAVDRAAQGLCAVIDGRCVTHDTVADYGHHLDHANYPPDHDYGD